VRTVQTALLFLMTASWLMGESYIREYSYNAGENDSKASARKAALDAVKTELIQEIGVTVISSMEKETSIQNDEAKTMIKSNLATFSVAMTKTEILDEKWDGEKFWIKVKMEVDADTMKNEVKKSIEVESAKRADASLGAVREAVYFGLMNLRTPERVRAVTGKAVTLPMAGDENLKVHQTVVEFFVRYGVHDDLYREFLIKTLAKITPEWNDPRAYMIFTYLAEDRMYNEAELKTIFDFFSRNPEYTARKYYRDFFAPAKAVSDDAALKLVERYLDLIQSGKIGRPIPVTLKQELKTVAGNLPEVLRDAVIAKYEGGAQ